MGDQVHGDVRDIVVTTNNDIVPLGVYRGVNEALAYLASIRLAEPRTEAWLEGFDEAVGAVEGERPLHPEYMNRVGILPDDLDFDPAPLLAVLADVEQQGADIGHVLAIGAGRNQRDTEVGPPAYEDYVSEVEDGDEPDEDEVADYQARADYIAGLQFVPDCLVAHYEVDPDPDWEPRSE